MLPDLTEFMGAFMHVQEGYGGRTGQDAEINREKVLKSVRKAFQASHEHEFQYEVTTRLLILHGHWQDVLKPLVIRDGEEDEHEVATTEDQESSNESTEHEAAGSEQFAPRIDESESDSSSDCQIYECVETLEVKEASGGVTRPRTELSDDTTDRLRRQRLNAAGDASVRNETQLDEGIGVKQLEVMERQLDWNIMTRSEEELSAEAVEYLRLQRAQILQKIRQKSGELQD
ncbi:hypothetical protein V7S43_002250 [Phytophthora oleae]|uniref:No apical meristem-associated C-terminal domain-containing protein n=1 Tax=Phytophthora oleae TaxID=2107226 RepID=A0ABD3G1B6_9STRA